MAALVVAVILAAVAACSAPPTTDEGHGAFGLGVYVPLVWKTNRLVTGHRKHVLEAKIPCASCHALSGDSMGEVTPMRCAECHARQATFEHAHREAEAKFGARAKTDCTMCHAFTSDGIGSPGQALLAAVTPPTACARCHVSKQNAAPQVATHGTSACTTCHKPHENGKPHGGPCLDCHRDVKTGHATTDRTATEVCTTCHQHQHAPASDAIGTCQVCHMSPASQAPLIPVTALFAGGHEQCIGCHRSHEFTKASVAPCRSCHEGIVVLATPKVPQHERCESCHSPHDVKGAGDQVCAGCHQNVHPDHPKTASGTCVGCHNPHPTGMSTGVLATIARPCSTCHQLAASDHAFHGGIACESCHAPHAFTLQLSDHTPCRNCHAKEVALASTNPPHQACQGCHLGLPHEPTRVEAACDTCHATIATAATKGHAECTKCHEPHGGAFKTECKACHAAEQQTAPAGHQMCTNCHEQHTGQQKAPCAGCHAAEAASKHASVPGGCASCHRPHGPEGLAMPPACTTCHEVAKLPGLHSVSKHQECTTCHTGHGDPTAPIRSPCLSCHADKQDHFPTAPSCASCHLFVPTK